MKKFLNEVELKDFVGRINKALDEGKVVAIIGKNVAFEPIVEDMIKPDSHSYLYINLSEESNWFEIQVQILLSGEFDGVMIDNIDKIYDKDKERRLLFVKAAFEKTFYSISKGLSLNFKELRVLLSGSTWPEFLSPEIDKCMIIENP